jgi:hypothetical protein
LHIANRSKSLCKAVLFEVYMQFALLFIVFSFTSLPARTAVVLLPHFCYTFCFPRYDKRFFNAELSNAQFWNSQADNLAAKFPRVDRRAAAFAETARWQRCGIRRNR